MPKQHDRRGNQSRKEVKIDKEKITHWIKNGFNGETISFTQEFGKELVDNRLTTSQIRNIFSEVKRIAGKVGQGGNNITTFKKDFLMLRPKLAYAAQRAGGRGIDSLREVLETAHIAVTEIVDQEDRYEKEANKVFENFVDFFEAILAYHKANGGRDQ